MSKREIIEAIIEKNVKIATAESCTGGLLAKTITDFPGTSAIFDLGLITYSNESKIKLLGVNPQTLAEYGAVSEQVAKEMVAGLRKISPCDIAISITGIAGPGGASDKISPRRNLAPLRVAFFNARSVCIAPRRLLAYMKYKLKNKPIGLVYVCINDDVSELNLKGDRQQIRRQTVDFVFDKIKVFC